MVSNLIPSELQYIIIFKGLWLWAVLNSCNNFYAFSATPAWLCHSKSAGFSASPMNNLDGRASRFKNLK